MKTFLRKPVIIIIALLITNLFFSPLANATNYFSAGNNAPDQVASWWTGTNGTGTHPANFTTNNNTFTIQSGHTMTTTANWTVSGTNSTILINSGGTLVASNAVTATVMTVNGTYQHNQNGGSIPVATWNANSNCNITGVTATVPTVTSFAQSFGNFTWNCSAQTSDISLLGNLTVINGTFTVTNTNSGSLRLSNSGVTATLTIAQDFIQTGGSFFISGTGGSGNTWIVNVNRNFSLSGGTFNMNGTTASVTNSLNVSGNFTISAGTLTQSGGTNNITYNGTGIQTYTSGGTISNVINFTVNSGSTLQMASPATTLTGGGTFTLTSGATLGVTSTAGITSSGPTGNIQVTGIRTFATGANYIYNGAANQAVGNGLTQNTPANFTIANTGVGGNNTVSLGAITPISGNVTLTQGILSAGTNNFSSGGNWINNVGSAGFSAGTATVTFSGTTQSIGGTATTTFNNLTLAGSGTKTFGVAVTTGNLSINTGVIANLSTFTHAANTLTLGGLGTALGSWGNTASAATNKNNTFFAATAGIVNVTTGSCTAPTITLGTIPSICSGALSFTIPYTATTGGPNQYSISGTGITAVNNASLPASAITVNLSSGASAGSLPFTLTVTNGSTACVSANINSSVTVNALPADPTPVTATPSTICAGAASNLNATSAGNTIRWYTVAAGGSNIGTSASGVNFPVSPSTTTPYYAEALSASGCVSAARTSLTVTVTPLPSTPSSVTATPATICAGASSNLNATSAGNTIQWYTVSGGGSNIGTSASGANFSVTPAGTITYYAEAMNAMGCMSATRAPVTVTVNALPSITGQPTNQTACTGGTAAFTITATGTGLTYQWRTGTTNLANGGNISGVTTATLSINPVGAGDALSNYNCVVTGTCTPSQTSNNVSLTVNSLTYSSNTVFGTTFTPCINMASNVTTVSTTIHASQYFVMNVIKGLTYQVYTNASPASGNALRLTVYEEGNVSGAVLASSVINTGNPAPGNANDVYLLFTSPLSGQVRVLINNRADCGSVTPANITTLANVSAGSNTQDDQSAAGTNNWVSHIYDGTNSGVAYTGSFLNYLGNSTTETETFNELFGNLTADNSCSSISASSAGTIRANVEDVSFSARYRMNSTKKGLYVADIGSDDGSRLAVDGTLIYNNFIDQSYAAKPRILMNLTGTSNLVLDFYENAGGNQLSFQTLTLVIANNLTTNNTQSVCLGNAGVAISGDVLPTLNTGAYAGITASGTGYQWSYSTTPGGTRTNISGATAAAYTPATNAAPFNVAGTYYLYRNAKLTSANNIGVTGYTATNESNAATLTVNALPAIAAITGGATSVCVSFTTPAFNDATAGGTWSITSGSGTAGITQGGIVNGLTAGTVTVVYTYSDGTCPNKAQQALTVNALPVVTAASAVCVGSTITLSPVTGGTWMSNDMTKANVTNAGVVTGVSAGSVTFTFTSSATGCSKTTSVVNVTAPPTAVSGGSQTICFGQTATVSGATSSNGTILWTSNGHGSLANAATLTPTYTPASGDENTTVTLTLTVSNAPCTAATATYSVIVQTPVVNAGVALSDICKGGTSSQLGGMVSGAATGGTWSDGGINGTFNPDATSLNATWTPPASYSGTAILSLTTSGGSCGTATASKTQVVDANCQVVTLTQPIAVTVNATSTNASCSNAADGTIIVSGLSTGATYKIQLNGTGADLSGQTTFGAGTYLITASAANGNNNGLCTATASVTITEPDNIWTSNAIDNFTDWNNPSNWTCGVPTGTTNIIIPASPANNSNIFPVIPATSANVIHNITIQPGAILTIAQSGTDTAKLTITGTYSNSGTLANNGKIILNGTSQQSFPGSGAIVTAMNALEINNTAGILIDKSFSLTGVLTPTAGTMSLGDNYITLQSDAANTARFATAGAGASVNYNGAGRFVVQRYFNSKRSWRLMTAPVSESGTIFNGWQLGGLTIATTPAAPAGQGEYVTGPGATAANGLDPAINNNYSLKVYNITTGALDPVTNTNVAISPGFAGSTPAAANIGYFNFVRGDRDPANVGDHTTNTNLTTLSDTGKLQMGPYTFPAVATTLKFTLIGNPYASPVYFPGITRSNLARRFYVWDPRINTVGAYVTVDDEDEDNNWSFAPDHGPAPTGTVQTLDIQSGQAFFVQTADNGPASLTFDEANKSGVDVGLLFRPAQASAAITSFRADLYLLNADNSTLIADGILAQFGANFSNDVDIKDGVKFVNVNENFAILRNTTLLSLERRQPITTTDTLFFSLTRSTQRNYQFQFSADGLYQAGVTAFLEDSYLQTSTPVDLSVTSTVNFSIADAASAVATRFRIVFKQSGALPITFTSLKGYQQNSGINVNWKVENEMNMKEYVVEKSVDGQLFTKATTLSAVQNNGSNAAYQWIDANPVSGNNYYRISSVDINGKVFYSNIIKVFIGKGKPSLMVYPNPVENGNINLQLINQPKGTYAIRLMNKLGQVIITKQIKHEEGSSTEVLQMKKTMAHGTYQLEVTKPDNSIDNMNVMY